MIIREATINDFKGLSNLEKHIDIERLKNKVEGKEIFILLNENKIIGWLRFSLFWDEHPFMNMLFILDDYRNKGYGKELVVFWEEKMKERGYKILMTSTLSNEEAQHFYRKIGYKDIGGFILPNDPLELILIKELNS